MRFTRSSSSPSLPSFEPELRVVRFISSRRGDAERGPAIWMHPSDAQIRLLTAGELAWITAPRGRQLATVMLDESITPHTCVLRDLLGVVVSEAVRVNKPDLDTPTRSERV